MRRVQIHPSTGLRPILAGIVLTLTVWPGPAHAAPSGTFLWAKRFGATTGGESAAVAASPDGSKVFVTGNDDAVGLVTTAYSASGNKLWLRKYDGAGGCCIDHGRAIVVSPDGGTVFVTGWTQVVDGTIDYVTLAYDAATGERHWAEVYDRGSMDGDEETPSQHDYAYSIGSSPDGGMVYVTGESDIVIGDTIHTDYGTLAYDAATGDLVWDVFYDGGVGTDSARSLGVSPDGGEVYVTGFSASGEGDSATATVAYDATDGSEMWAERYEGPAGHHDSGLSLVVGPDGSAVYVTGGTGGTASASSDWDMVTLAYAAAGGAPLWDKRYTGPSGGYDFGRAITVSPDGSKVFVVGHSLGESGRFDVTTIGYGAATGKRRWVQRVGGPSTNLGLSAGIDVSPDGSAVFVASHRTRSGASDLVTLSYSVAGAPRWLQLYDGGGVDRAAAVAVNPAGKKVFVTGSGGGGLTLGYAA